MCIFMKRSPTHVKDLQCSPCRSSVDSGHTKFCVHHTTMHHVTSCKATYRRKVYACLAVTCHLHFWQNDRDLLRATAVTRGWNGYHSKKQ